MGGSGWGSDSETRSSNSAGDAEAEGGGEEVGKGSGKKDDATGGSSPVSVVVEAGEVGSG